MKTRVFYLVCFAMIVLLLSFISGCKKKEITNPYDAIQTVVVDNPDVNDIPSDNFAWLHGKIFRPTCANSGCHDGTFEPDFRSISSAYNSLVNHPCISNDEQNTYTYRVVPSNADASLLHARLTTNIPNTSGMMPLTVDPGSDWNDNSQQYKQAITDWINNGAKDMYGQSPDSGQSDFPPQISGLVIFPSGNTTTPYERDPESVGVSPILVEPTSVDIWVLVVDDNTPIDQLTVNEFKVAESLVDFASAPAFNYTFDQSLVATDFSGNSASFTHKVTIDLSSYEPGTVLFMRSFFNDGVQSSTTAIPDDGSNPYITAIFTMQIQ